MLSIQEMTLDMHDTTLGAQKDFTKLHHSFMSMRIGTYTPLPLGKISLSVEHR